MSTNHWICVPCRHLSGGFQPYKVIGITSMCLRATQKKNNKKTCLRLLSCIHTYIYIYLLFFNKYSGFKGESLRIPSPRFFFSFGGFGQWRLGWFGSQAPGTTARGRPRSGPVTQAAERGAGSRREVGGVSGEVAPCSIHEVFFFGFNPTREGKSQDAKGGILEGLT